jgi:hypothetical protein
MNTLKITLIALATTVVQGHTAMLTLIDSVGSPNSVSITPGSAFSASVFLSSETNETFAGLSYFLTGSGPENNVFSITNRDITGSNFTDLTSTNANVIAGGALNPSNDNDLGGLLSDVLSPVGPGSFFVATFSFSSNPLTSPGVYTIGFLSNAVYVDADLNDIPFSSLGSYNVEVIPEPTTVVLLAGSLTAMMLLRRRRTS